MHAYLSVVNLIIRPSIAPDTHRSTTSSTKERKSRAAQHRIVLLTHHVCVVPVFDRVQRPIQVEQKGFHNHSRLAGIRHTSANSDLLHPAGGRAVNERTGSSVGCSWRRGCFQKAEIRNLRNRYYTEVNVECTCQKSPSKKSSLWEPGSLFLAGTQVSGRYNTIDLVLV